MATHTLKVICNHSGCGRNLFYSFTNKRDYNDAKERYSKYLCTKHSRPEDIIETKDYLKKEIKYEVVDGSFTSTNLKNIPQQKQLIGRGFRIFSEDFPEGTKIKITIEVDVVDDLKQEILYFIQRKEKFSCDDKNGNTLEIYVEYGLYQCYLNRTYVASAETFDLVYKHFKQKYNELNF